MFPSVTSLTTNGTGGVNTSPVTIPIPSGPIGELIVVIFSQDALPTIGIDTAFSGNNWRNLPKAAYSNIVSSIVYYKQAEGGDQLRLNLGFADQSTWAVYRIADGYTLSGSSFAFDGVDGDPPSHTPPDGLQDYLFIVARAGDSTVQATAAPSGYSGLTSRQGGTQGATISVATKQAAATSENPGVFTSAAEQQVLWTLAVSPVKRIFVDFHADSVVTATPKVIRRNSTSVAAQSGVSVSGVRVKLSSTAFAGHTVSDDIRSIIYNNSSLDSLGDVIFDSDQTTLYGVESATVGVFTRIDATGKLQSSGTRIQRSSTAVAAHSVVTVTRKIIRKSTIQVIASSGVVVTRKIIRRPVVLISAHSVLDTGSRVGTNVGRLTQVDARSIVTTIQKVVRPSQVSIAAHSSMASSATKKSIRKLLMTASSIYASARRILYYQSASFTGHSSLILVPRSKTNTQTSVAAVSSVTLSGKRIQRRSGQVSSESSVLSIGRIIRGRSTQMSAYSTVSLTPRSRLASSTRRERAGSPVRSAGHAREVR